MKHLTLLFAAALACLCHAHTHAAPPQNFRVEAAEPLPATPSGNAADIDTRSPTDIEPRAIDAAPSGYSPATTICPSARPKIRAGNSISPQEQEWLLKRRNETIPEIRKFLNRMAIRNFDSEKYLADVETNATALPNIGIAISGGGYRALLSGAGAIAAWDSRSSGSEQNGNLGGLLQSATYISGLSTGAWLLGSLYINNLTSVQDAVDAPQIWQFESSIFKGPAQYSLRGYYTDVFNEVDGKQKANYSISITDYLGRMAAYQVVNATNGGPGYTWSSIANDTAFSDGKAPLPIVLANGRYSTSEVMSPTNSTIYEFTPWELGSSDPTLAGWAPLMYVGSKFDKGEIPDDENCVTGFDNAGFVMGTSSTVLNQAVLSLKDDSSSSVPSKVPKFVFKTISNLISSLGPSNGDLADWSPNPFYGFNMDSNPNANDTNLALVDGNEDIQNIPYHPHLHPQRKVDVIFSYDSSADTEYGWPDGASAVASYERALQPQFKDTNPFPPVPDKNSFVNLGLNSRPVFFGCNATNFTATGDAVPPLVVYLPNHPYVYFANLTTFQLTVSDDERAAVIDNGWAVATQLNATRDTEWPACVGCAILSRGFDRTNTTVPRQCKQCFDRYCWKGNTNNTTPNNFDPTYYGKPIEIQDSAGHVLAPMRSTTLLTSAVLVMLMLAQ